jgi:microcystin-dependent protein
MSEVFDTSVNPDADGLVGAFTPYAGETLPSTKYRWCHGAQTLSRTEFSLLFSRIGERWGVGDGSTTFNLPNLDKLMLVGLDSTGADTDFDTVGGTGGTKAATMPSHTHGGVPTLGTVTGIAGGGTGVASNETGSTTTASAGGTGDNMPPFATVRFIIKVM